MISFSKYHALGNDYIVITPVDKLHELSEQQIRLICHRNYGVGSDGILFGPLESSKADFALRIYNPDGSEAEKSGNGIRIFARFLFDGAQVSTAPFTVETLGGVVKCEIYDAGQIVRVEMGKASFGSRDIPITGADREVINEPINVLGTDFTYSAVTVGNPHCVVLCSDISSEMAKKYGPAIETDSRFPNKTNVQFLKVIDRNNISIEIWERGAGYTLASGSSSCAAASVAYRLGYCDGNVTVHMPGGKLKITISPDFELEMVGPVTSVCQGIISKEILL